MANSVNLLVTTKNGNKTKTSTITHVNPEAADSSLTTFATTMYSLSKSELVNVSVAEKRSLDLPVTNGVFTASPTSLTMDVEDTATITLTTASSGAISFVPTSNIKGDSQPHAFKIQISGKTVTVTAPARLSAEAIDAFSDTLVLNLAETDDYPAASTSVTLNFKGCGQSITPDDGPEGPDGPGEIPMP